MRRRYGYYWTKLIVAAIALAGWVVAFIWIGDSWWQLVSAGVLAVVMTQISFLGHDAAHRQIFKSGRWNDWVSLVLANLFVGISYGWWRSKHTRHHANPNKAGSDPDIELLGDRFHPRTCQPPPQPSPALAGRPSGLVLLSHLVARGPFPARRRGRSCPGPRQDRASLGRDGLLGRPARRPGRARLHRACHRRRQSSSWPSSWLCSGSTWASPSPRTTSACPWCHPT